MTETLKRYLILTSHLHCIMECGLDNTTKIGNELRMKSEDEELWLNMTDEERKIAADFSEGLYKIAEEYPINVDIKNEKLLKLMALTGFLVSNIELNRFNKVDGYADTELCDQIRDKLDEVSYDMTYTDISFSGHFSALTRKCIEEILYDNKNNLKEIIED